MNPRTDRRRAGFSLLAALLFTACDDATVSPYAEVVAAETEAALALGVELPDPAGWTLGDEPSPEDAAIVAEWQLSWEQPGASGRAVREALYPALARTLGGRMSRGDVAEEVERLGVAVDRASALSDSELPERIRVRLGAARDARVAADAAVRAERLDAALEEVIRGSDELRAVGPEAVARSLVAEVDDRLRRISERDTYDERDLERLENLLRRGQQAIDEGDWVRAIRRAYYARGLIAAGGS